MKLLNNRSSRHLRAARLALCAILIAAASGGLSTASRACGTAVHHEILDQAYGILDKQTYSGLATLLETYHGAAEAGTLFPDWGYGMAALYGDPAYSNYAEVAHVGSYRAAYTDCVRAFFRQPRNEDDLKTITFLFGLIGHQEADNPWHFGPNAFEPVADQQDTGDASAIEIAGDVFANVEYGEFSDGDYWIFPVDAARAAYLAMGYDVSADDLAEGMSLLSTAHEALQATSYAQYPWELVWRGWTHSNLQTWPDGGMQDGATHTAAAWQQTWDELSAVRVFLPLLYRGPEGRLKGGLRTASIWRQTADGLHGEPAGRAVEPVRAGDSGRTTARLMVLAQALIDEGAVQAHWHLENGFLIIERIEILDYQRLDQLTRQMLGGPSGLEALFSDVSQP